MDERQAALTGRGIISCPSYLRMNRRPSSFRRRETNTMP